MRTSKELFAELDFEIDQLLKRYAGIGDEGNFIFSREDFDEVDKCAEVFFDCGAELKQILSDSVLKDD